jgi:isochorismate synthase
VSGPAAARPPVPPPTDLQAVTVALGPGEAVDPFAVAGEDGTLFAAGSLALAGRGEAAVLALPGGLGDRAGVAAVGEWLAAVPHDDRVGGPGTRVTAFASLPFDPGAAGELVVPALTYGRDAVGREWATVVGPAPGPDGEFLEGLRARLAGHGAAAPGPPAGPGVVRITRRPDGPGYRDAVSVALGALAAGELQKVVLARSLILECDGPVRTGPALRRLQAAEPACTVFALPVAGGRFVGASPELLVRRRDRSVSSHPLAGTVALDATDAELERQHIDRFLASAKDRVEHSVVVDDIVSALGPLCASLTVPDAPSLVRLHTVAHLGTRIAGELSGAPGAPPGALELLAALHPTAAVGGIPRAAALECIARLEPEGRGHWAGPVGWTDAAGDGEWMIGIRSATVRGREIVLLAGAGIVVGSDPDGELAETAVKLAPMLEAFAATGVDPR